VFQLVKTWIDPAQGIATVEIRYTWTPLGQAPRWDGNEEAEVMLVVPNTSPTARQVTIEIPRYVQGNDRYALHYRFGPGGEHRAGYSPPITEEIVSREVDFEDREGRITQVRVLWGVNGWGAPNWSQTILEGLALRFDDKQPGHDPEGQGVVDDAIYELVQTVPLPRRYLGKVWGPRGAEIEYVFQLLRTGSPRPEDDFEAWDNNQARNYRAVLD
jgi:hypothetical protein